MESANEGAGFGLQLAAGWIALGLPISAAIAFPAEGSDHARDVDVACGSTLRGGGNTGIDSREGAPSAGSAGGGAFR